MTKEIPSVLNDALGFNIDRVAKLFRHQLTIALAEYDLSPEQWQIMSVIWNSDGLLNQQHISQLTFRDKHNVSRLIKRLEGKGWLEKRPNPNDSRAFFVTATEESYAQKEAVTTALLGHFDNIGLGITETEQTHLLSLLKVIRNHLGDNEELGI